MNVAVIGRLGEIFVTPVSMKQKYAVGVNNGKVFLNLKRISIAGKVSRRGECRDCRKWKRPIPEKAREEFEKTNPQPPMGKPFHCPICGRTIIRQYKNDVVLDHFHDTGEVRGWICRMCNNSMGMMEDDVNILKRAIKWLQGTLRTF